MPAQFDIHLACNPGQEAPLAAEARARNFGKVRPGVGAVTIRGGWREVWRANLQLRGTSRVLAQIVEFRATHLAEIERATAAVDWGALLGPAVPFAVEATCTRSRIYHSDAAAERITRAIAGRTGADPRSDAQVVIRARIASDVVTLSVDTSGEALYKRGAKQAVGKAPMRETLAAMFLAQCGFTGGEPVVDPMCGSGTFVIEAAEIAAGLAPGRARRFAFESLATFDAADWERLKVLSSARTSVPSLTFFGSDRDAGAVRMARENAKRAGVASFTRFEVQDIEEAAPPAGPAGLVVLNPPYGGRIGETRHLVPLYRAIGRVLGTGFAGWRVGLVTSEPRLAEATGLAFAPPPDAVLNGGLRLRLYVTGPLGARARD